MKTQKRKWYYWDVFNQCWMRNGEGVRNWKLQGFTVKLLPLLLLALSSFVAMGQSKGYTLVLAQDTTEEIYSFRMTSDTNKLKPIDTTFYTMGNQIYREVKYKYMIDESPMYLFVRSYNENHHWIFFAFQLAQYKKQP